MNKHRFERKASNILSVLGNPFRIKIAFALSEQEACVCHLETLLKKRQSYISQHLMALRKAGLLETRRDGKFVYYRLSNPGVIKLIEDAAVIAGFDLGSIPELSSDQPLEKCICPHCGEMEENAKLSSSALDLGTVNS